MIKYLLLSLLFSSTVSASPSEVFNGWLSDNHSCLARNEFFFTLSVISPPKRLSRWEQAVKPGGVLARLPEKLKKDIVTMAMETGYFISPQDVANYNKYLSELTSWILVINSRLEAKDYTFALDIDPIYIEPIRQGYESVGWLVTTKEVPGFNLYEKRTEFTFSH